MKRTLLLLLCLSLLFTGCAKASFTEPGIFYYHRTDTAFRGSEGVVPRKHGSWLASPMT